jgi:hypothetical protein
MNKIDTASWKNFKISDLFELKRPVARSQSKYEEGDIPFIASGDFNNGVVKYCKPKDGETLDEGNCITVSPLDGSAFYQPVSFLGRGGAGSAILVLYNEKITKSSGLFIATAIRASLARYSYADQLNSKTIMNEHIKLPVDAAERPDWDYMDSFMKNVMNESKACLDNLRLAKKNKNPVDVTKWADFEIGTLFDCVKPTVLHNRQVVEDADGIPYVVRTKFNNGIKFRVSKTKEMKPSPKGVISFGSENATFFYQQEEFVSGRDIYYLDTRGISENACQFMAACLRTIARKYSYNYGLFPDLLKSEHIKLPCDSNGCPDWQYMDSYMADIMETSKQSFEKLLQI